MIELLERLRDSGNSVLVVEHDPAVMAHADQIIESGPAPAPTAGGLCSRARFAELRDADTPTGRALARQRPVKVAPRPATGNITVTDASRNNLRNVTVRIPTGVMTVLTGVAGSGKSSFADELVAAARRHGDRPEAGQHQPPLHPDHLHRHRPGDPQAVRRGTTTSRPACSVPTPTGACPGCNGLGVIYTDLAFMDGQEVVCETCHGRRFTPEVLAHNVNGLSIADVDELTDRSSHCASARRGRSSAGSAAVRRGRAGVSAAGAVVEHAVGRRVPAGEDREGAAVRRTADHVRARRADDRPAPERHRHAAARPRQPCRHGHTVVVVEHNLDVIRRADWLIDLGPGPAATAAASSTKAGPPTTPTPQHPPAPPSQAPAEPPILSEFSEPRRNPWGRGRRGALTGGS